MAKATIMIVEDDGIVATSIQQTLENLGYAVSAVIPSGEQALQKVEECPLDLVLMDIKLKGQMSGTEAAHKIRFQFNIPVIYLTAYSDNEVLEKAKFSEPFGYIIKPFEEQELQSAIEIALYKHKMEKRLKESEQWLTTTLKCIGDGVIATDTKGLITFLNPIAESLTGWKKAEAIGKPVEKIFHIVNEISGERCEDLVNKVLKTGKVFGLANETVLIPRDNENKRLIGDSAAPIINERGEVLGVIIVFRDITLERQMQEQLHHSQKMLSIGTLAGGIAHDFNNILGAILGYADLTLEDVPESSTAKEYAREIRRASIRAKNLVKQILAFSRKEVQSLKPIKLQNSIKEIITMLRSTTPTTIEIHQSIDEQCCTVQADPTQINQVLVNLCTNASQAMIDTGGVLEIGLKEEMLDKQHLQKHPHLQQGTYIVLSVSDTGTGIDPKIREKIFDPFFTTKGVGQGTGMGLAVVYGIVKSHGGAITVESTLGKGTTFHILLPRSGQQVAEAKETKGTLPRGTERVLLIDDEETLLAVGKKMLESLGYSVITTSNGTEAIELFKKEPGRFDIIITDQTMPHMTGFELAREIINIQPEIPIILCTGYSETVSEYKAKSTGIKDFVLKPMDRKELAVKVRTVLDNK